MSLFDLLVVTRWIHFAALFLLFGVPLFWLISGENLQTAHGLPRSLRASILLLRIAVPVALVTGILWLVETLANMAGGFASVVDPPTLQLFFFSTQFGPVAMLRLALLATLAIVGFLPLRRRHWFLALLVIAALLLVSQAWFGHAAEGGTSLAGAEMILAYSFHVLAGAAWVGGLPVLFMALVELRDAKIETATQALNLCSRYSAMALLAVCVIVLSGIANTVFRVGLAFDRLFLTAYGTILLIKLLLVAVMLALAYCNRWVAMPRLRADAARALVWLRISIGVELALGVLVLGAAAVLGITPPPQ